MRSDKRIAIVIAVAAVFTVATRATAHRLDELLQATRIDIGDDRIELELDLTPGIAMAHAIGSDIDRDGDGTFSEAEQRAFVDRVFNALQLRADDTTVQLTPTAATFAAGESLQTGNGVIAMRAMAPLSNQREGAHHIYFNNSYRRDGSVYLANALLPTGDRIAITAQHRDGPQSELTIDYRVEAQPPAALPFAGVTAAIAVIAAVVRKSLFR